MSANNEIEAAQANWFVIEGDDGKYYPVPRRDLEMGMNVLFSSTSRVSTLLWIYDKEEQDANA